MKYIVNLFKFAYVLVTTICSLIMVVMLWALGSSKDARFEAAKMLLEIDGKEIRKVKKTNKNTGLKMKIGFESE